MSKEENKEKKINVTDNDTASVNQSVDEEKKAGSTNEESATKKDSDEDTHTDKKAEEEKKTDPLAEAQKQIDELKDQLLRKIAEFDNFRKRTRKEKDELIFNGSEKAIVAILPVLDDMERAIANAHKDTDGEKIEEGWELIYKKFQHILEGLGVKRIDTKDADFNVDYHEAIAMVPNTADDKKGKVIDCVQAGYTLNDKVIRHAKVAVGN